MVFSTATWVFPRPDGLFHGQGWYFPRPSAQHEKAKSKSHIKDIQTNISKHLGISLHLNRYSRSPKAKSQTRPFLWKNGAFHGRGFHSYHHPDLCFSHKLCLKGCQITSASKREKGRDNQPGGSAACDYQACAWVRSRLLVQWVLFFSAEVLAQVHAAQSYAEAGFASV